MKLWSNSFKDGADIPGEFAFCVTDEKSHVALSANRNPHLAWSGVPPNAKSLVLICHDYDVPSRGDDVNQEGRSIPANLPRVDFFHWTLIDIPVSTSSIEAGEYSDGITKGGKSGPEALATNQTGVLRHGLNDYTGWFANDGEMSGNYYGYDGPCPPWNDSIIHHYVFTLFALNIDSIEIGSVFTGGDVRMAMLDHVIEKVSMVGTYSLNPSVTNETDKAIVS